MPPMRRSHDQGINQALEYGAGENQPLQVKKVKGGCKMPRRDGTGPMGMGSRTGWGAGGCTGYARRGNAIPAQGRGYGMGFGRGRGPCGWGAGAGRGRGSGYGPAGPWAGGWAYGASSESAAEMERQNLEARAEALQAELDLLKQRMARYEDEPTAE